MPPVNQPDLGHDCYHAGLSPADLFAPFTPPEVPLPDPKPCDSPAGVTPEPCRLRLRLLTFNVLSLLDKTAGKSSQEAGLHMQPSRAAILAGQLEAADVHIAFLQETGCPEGTYRAGPYVRFVSGHSKGQWSVEIWIRTGYAFAAAGAANAPVHTLTQQGITVLLAEPRRLILRLVCGKFRAVLAALHGPHRAVESGIIDAWWSETSKHLSQATPL